VSSYAKEEPKLLLRAGRVPGGNDLTDPSDSEADAGEPDVEPIPELAGTSPR
jgi:hypothetical protein